MSDRSNLAASIDGAPLPDEEARDLWTRFSRYMDEHRGDMAGFARENGYVSVTPTFDRGRALLVVRTTEAPPEKPAPRTGGGTPPPRAGGGGSAPRAGGNKPAPRAGGNKPAPRAAGGKPAPRAGGNKPAPRAGGKPSRGRR
ncbi:uncharacterized protein SOCE26_005730 [Sorangium cellulosum]|uniref:Uncharacterized protein n=1 Tax=Sorangium cellulosum TaxID=56 RepID=A0A2L0EIR7_SORCE|nr:hypothetical protein [Sorangium cellulosum]AUX39191.1 uncharacterized protein SOCE26_005730 [Sorangium cellulosum]